MTDLIRTTGATFSPCGAYRYKLWRTWDATMPACNFLMLNPSTADDVENDPTVERCERRAVQWGYGGLVVTNLFAFRATDPRVMRAARDPVGPWNDATILDAAEACAIVVCAWGVHGKLLGRSEAVRRLLAQGHIAKLFALRVSKGGEPCHPLYLPYSLRPVVLDLCGYK